MNDESYIDEKKIAKTFKKMEDPMLHWDIVDSKLLKPSDEVLKQREKKYDKKCACGCRVPIQIQKHHIWKGIPNFIRGHHNKGENNVNWSGDKVGKKGLHSWIRNHKPLPIFCEDCNIAKPYDVANVSGEYKRDINDYKWLCRSCHMKMDYKNGSRKISNTTPMIIKCLFCGKEFRRKHGRNKQKYCSHKCSVKGKNND